MSVQKVNSNNRGSVDSGSSRDSTQKSSASSLSMRGRWDACLDVNKLERLLCRTIPQFCPEEAKNTDRFQGLAAKYQKKSQQSRRALLSRVSDWLSQFVSSKASCTLPTELVAQINIYIGLVEEEIHSDNNNNDAQQQQRGTKAYVTAIWLLQKATPADEYSKRLLCNALYRLANAYARLGKYREMQELIDQAEVLQQENLLVDSLSSSGFVW